MSWSEKGGEPLGALSGVRNSTPEVRDRAVAKIDKVIMVRVEIDEIGIALIKRFDQIGGHSFLEPSFFVQFNRKEKKKK